jgi:hypothetical protein
LSQAIGYGVTVVGFALQVPARIACDRLSGGPRLIVADLYQFLCFCGTVNLWRGVWNLLNIYFLPGESKLTFYHFTNMLFKIINTNNNIDLLLAFMSAKGADALTNRFDQALNHFNSCQLNV